MKHSPSPLLIVAASALVLFHSMASCTPPTDPDSPAPSMSAGVSRDWQWWDVVESLCVSLAAIATILGIRSWRVQLRGTKEYDLAEQALTLFYEARDAIQAIRSPLGWAGEGSSRKAPGGEDPELKQIRDNAFVGLERYEARQECFSRLYALRYRFMAVFGKDSADSFDAIQRILTEILSAYRQIGRSQEQLARGRVPKHRLDSHYERIDKAEEIIWTGGETDEITQRVDDAISRMEGYCERILRSRSRIVLHHEKPPERTKEGA